MFTFFRSSELPFEPLPVVEPPPEPEPELVQVIPEVEIDLDVEPMIAESEEIHPPITSTADLLEVIIPEEDLDEDIIRYVPFPSTRIFHNMGGTSETKS